MIARYIARRAYHYYGMNVADYFDRGCLILTTLIERKAALENDKVYSKLAHDYWILHGKVYHLKDDGLWIRVDRKIDHELRLAENRYARAKPLKPARFPLEDNLYEIWKNLEQNREKYKKIEIR